MPPRRWLMLFLLTGWILRVSVMFSARSWPTTSSVRWLLPTLGLPRNSLSGLFHSLGGRLPTRAQCMRRATVRARRATAKQTGIMATVAGPAAIITGRLLLPIR